MFDLNNKMEIFHNSKSHHEIIIIAVMEVITSMKIQQLGESSSS